MKRRSNILPHLWMPVLGTALILAGIGVEVSDRLVRQFRFPAPLPTAERSLRSDASLAVVPFVDETVQGVRWAGRVKPAPQRKVVRKSRSQAPDSTPSPTEVLARVSPAEPTVRAATGLERKVDGLLGEVAPQGAVEVTTPLEALTEEGLSEEAVAWHRAVEWGTSPETGSEVRPYLVTLGSFEKTDFTALADGLQAIKTELDALKIASVPKTPAKLKAPLSPRPEPELVRPKAPAKVAARPAAPPKKEVSSNGGPRPKAAAQARTQVPKPQVPPASAAPRVLDARAELQSLAPATNAAPRAVSRELDARAELAQLSGDVGEGAGEADTVESSSPLSIAREAKPSAPVLDAEVALQQIRSEPSSGNSVPEWDAREAMAALSAVESSAPEAPAPAPLVGPMMASAAPVSQTTGRMRWIAKASTPASSPAKSEPRADSPTTLAEAPTRYAARTSPKTVVRSMDRIFGQVSLDRPFSEWLDQEKGHIELSLQPVSSANAQDAVFVTYRFPEPDFEVDLHGSTLNYRLIASVFSPKVAAPVARIPYREILTPANHKRKVRFHLTRELLERYRDGSAARAGRSLVLTVFEGGTGDIRDAKPIRGASLQMIGFAEEGVRIADKEGNIRISDLPSHSEFLVRVSAPGYFPAYSIVPVFGVDAYVPLYLVPKERVEAINDFRYLVSSREDKSTDKLGRNNPLRQDVRKGFIMGRSFDPVKRSPLAGEVFGLTFRTEPALYFGAFPAPELRATSDSGMFSFFNVAPSFRAIRREGEGGVKRPVSLVKVRPGTGQYVEFGRGGLRDLEARVWDPYRNLAPASKVRMVGDTAPRLETDGTGKVLLEDVDLGPGVITLEVESEGYPLTWHTLPWNPRASLSLRNLFVMEEELLIESAERFAGVEIRSDGGAVVGGAESAFFHRNSCVTVALYTDKGVVVDSAFGPFPLSAKPLDGQPLCLTRSKPGFTYFNLPSGEYVLRWEDENKKLLRSHVIHVGVNRVTVVVN